MNVVATTPSGRKIYLAAPETHAVAEPTLYVYHEGKHVDVGDALDKLLNLSMKPVSFTTAEDAQATPASLGVPKDLFRIRSGLVCYCLVCGHEGPAYGNLTSSGGTSGWCKACGRNDYLIPLDKVNEVMEKYKDSIEVRWQRDPKCSQIVRCTGSPCEYLRPCESPAGDGCSVPDVALPALGFIKRAVLKSGGA